MRCCNFCVCCWNSCLACFDLSDRSVLAAGMGDLGGMERDRLICLLFRGEGGTLPDRLGVVRMLLLEVLSFELLSLFALLLSTLELEGGGTTGLSDMVKVNLGKKSLGCWEVDDDNADEFWSLSVHEV